MATLMERPLSVKFSLYNFRGLNHRDVLESLQTQIKTENIRSIQMKEKECIVTVTNIETKNKLIVSTFELQNKSVSFLDVDSIITNITVKDAPYEMADSVIATHLSKYGDILSGSMTRGKIRGTDIDNGTRYVKILNCVSVLPLRDQIGRFEIRLFADNNRTPCRHCNETTHPCFKCPQRELQTRSITCWRCGGNHHKKDCQEKRLCHFCGLDDHLYQTCPHRLYGEYANDIIEGQEAGKSDATDSDSDWGDSNRKEPETSKSPSDNRDDPVVLTSAAEASQATAQDNPEVELTPAQRLPVNENVENANNDSTDSYRAMLSGNKVIIGDSNGNRLHVVDKDIHNLSKSGAKFADVEKLIQDSDITNVDSVVIHLGTNNLKTMNQQTAIENAKSSLEHVKSKWPSADIAFSSIIPKTGKNKNIKEFNTDAKQVNSALLQFCLSTNEFHYIDNDDIFYDNNKVVKSLYDNSDPSGIHVNKDGAKALYKNLIAFLVGGISDESEMDNTRNKRLRSDGSTSSQDLRAAKQSRNQTNVTNA